MYNHLSDKQKQILRFSSGKVVIKACPGSGKTYSVAARISKLLSDAHYRRKGIAALSFTNVACDEIESKLTEDFNILTPLEYPHYLGTIDRFLNQYVFLPFGHLYMGCKTRPELVGDPHPPWSLIKYEYDYDQYFDKTTFNINNEIIRIADSRSFKFKWIYWNKDGSINGHIKNLYKSKKRLFREGYANQSDANYISLKLLQKYPLIADNIANQFQYLIVDEAQDTDDIQMEILDILASKGAENIMLIGDRDQAIFEWNNARPELFDDKYNAWNKIKLDENRRSSQRICDFIKHMSSFDEITAVNNYVKNFAYNPEILGFKWTKKVRGKDEWIVSEEESISSFQPIMDYYLTKCKEEHIEINKDNVAILFRGKGNLKYIGLRSDRISFESLPWVKNKYYVRDIVRGKHLMENGNYVTGYKLLEKGFFEALKRKTDKSFICNTRYMKKQIELIGFKQHRQDVFQFIDILPSTIGVSLKDWVSNSNELINQHEYDLALEVNIEESDLLIDELFGSDLNTNAELPFYYGSVHSAKGKTFESVLLMLGKSTGSSKNYSTILKSDASQLNYRDREELRIVYVAISRPRKILVLAVPEDDISIWEKKFGLN